MKFTKESILKSLNSLTMPAWIKRVFQLIVDYIDDAASSIDSKADLVDGKVPIEQLPSYVDDVVEFQSIISYSGLKGTIGNAAYKDKLFFVSTDPYKNKFVNTKDNTAESDWEIIDPEDGKIYININGNHSYRWTGSTLLDLDKDFSNGINTLNNIVKVTYIGIVNNLDDIAEGDQTGLNQTGMRQLFSFLFNYKSYRNSYIEFENEDTDSRLCRIIDINGGKRQFTIYNNGALQTYKQLNTGGKYSLEKISDIPGYIYFDYNDASSNKIAANSLKTNKAVPALLAINEYVFIGYCTKINEGTTAFIVFNKQAMETYSMDNLTGTFIFINRIDTDTIVNYDSIRGSKTNAEAKQELTNILRGDTVVLSYTKAGSTLDENTIAALKKASQVILLNDNTTIQNSKSVYTVVTKTSAYLYFAKVENLGSGDNVINYNELTVTLSTSVWNIYARQFTLPYGCYIAAGFSNKNKNEVNNTLGRLLNADVAVIDNTDLGTTLSSDKLTQVLNCTWLLLKETNGKIREFSRGYDVSGNIYYNSVRSLDGGNYITINASTGALSALQTYDYGYSVFTKYKYFNGTKTTAESFYKEMVAQFTEDTYVIDNSKIGTVLTDADDAAIKKATSIVITNYNGRTIKLLSGNNDSEYIHFANTISVANGGAICLLLAYNISTKTFITDIRNISSYEYYKYNSTIDISVDEFNKINSFLYDNVFIIDKALINTAISNETVIAGLKRATMVIVKPTNNTETPVIYIVGNSNNDSNNIREFFNISNANNIEIIINRLALNFATNKLTMYKYNHKTPYATYTNAGGTKYTTEADFNAQFVKIMDMTVTQ